MRAVFLCLLLASCEPPGLLVPDPFPPEPPPTLGECYEVTGDWCSRCLKTCKSYVIYESICTLRRCLSELPDHPCDDWPDSCKGALDVPYSQCE